MLCQNESGISLLESNSPVVDSRYSRLSFQSADSKKSYKYRVSFDNVSNIAAKPLISYTLRTASEGYQTSSSPDGRLFMLIIDDHSCDEEIENVIRYVAVRRRWKQDERIISEKQLLIHKLLGSGRQWRWSRASGHVPVIPNPRYIKEKQCVTRRKEERKKNNQLNWSSEYSSSFR